MDIRPMFPPLSGLTPSSIGSGTPTEPAPRAKPEALPTTQRTTVPPPEGLSLPEWQMIQRYFPPSEKLALRLYGPDRSTHTLQPGAIGSQLDVRG